MSDDQTRTPIEITCPSCGSPMVKKETYDGGSATEWNLTTSSSVAASGSFYREKSVFKCINPECGRMLLV
jgi:hypothetical protein